MHTFYKYIGLGNNSIHSTCAVLFFFLTDVVAGVLACDPKTEAGKRPRTRMFNMFVFIVMSLCTMVRVCKLFCDFKGSPLPQNGDNFVIIAEVIEVSFFVVFMNTTAQTLFTGISWSLVTSPQPPSGKDLIVAITAKKLVQIATALIVFVLATTYIIGEKTQLSGEELPLIGDMWTFKPNNWISRWSTVQACSACIWVALFSQLAFAANEWSNTDTALVVLQIASVLSFAGSGIIDKSDGENLKYHDFFTSLFFILANVFALITVFFDQVRYNRRMKAKQANAEKPSMVLLLLGLIAAATSCRYLSAFSNHKSGGDSPTPYEILEWVDMIVITAFYALNCLYRAASSEMSLAFIIIPNELLSTSSTIEGEDEESSRGRSGVKKTQWESVAAAPRSEMGISLL
jgi:hypothetical protein